MKTDSFPLPEALPGLEYTIDHIKSMSACKINLGGYGIMPGTKIKLLFKSPSNNPCAYEIMGAVLAIRNDDSNNIYIIP